MTRDTVKRVRAYPSVGNKRFFIQWTAPEEL